MCLLRGHSFFLHQSQNINSNANTNAKFVYKIQTAKFNIQMQHAKNKACICQTLPLLCHSFSWTNPKGGTSPNLKCISDYESRCVSYFPNGSSLSTVEFANEWTCLRRILFSLFTIIHIKNQI